MCGRYALSIAAAFVRYQIQQQYDLPVDDAPEDDDTRQTYNFAPGYYGLVYRAEVERPPPEERDNEDAPPPSSSDISDGHVVHKLQAMKWGLVPFWTKRSPDYGTIMRTINSRDDSLAEKQSMWTSMKKKKRCVVIAEGFYEWLKKNDGKDKIPHFSKRKDGKLMLFAGLWDCVQYEGSEDKNYTYSIVTTEPNQQIRFLHDRMPVILDTREAIETWLDPKRDEWTEELQNLLQPFTGELDIYAVTKDVGKVGNNSPSFIVPLASSKNRNNIANYFSSPQKSKNAENQQSSEKLPGSTPGKDILKKEPDASPLRESFLKSPTTPTKAAGIKHGRDEAEKTTPKKAIKMEEYTPETKPLKTLTGKTIKSATNNSSKKASPIKANDGSQKITSFFTK